MRKFPEYLDANGDSWIDMTLTQFDAAEMVKNHELWVNDDDDQAGEQLILEGGDFPRVTDFSNRDLQMSSWEGVILRAADLKGANLEFSRFYGCDLRETDFRGSNLESASFIDCELGDALFHEANVRKTKFVDCNLTRTGCIACTLGNYSVVVTPTHASVECRAHPHSVWNSATVSSVRKWAPGASAWWAEYGTMLKFMASDCARYTAPAYRGKYTQL